jgi:diaminopimelate decarboxylase
MLKLFPQTAQILNNHLHIGGCDVTSLAAEFGTPLYIYDESTIRGNCTDYRNEFAKHYPNSLVVYACKAFINPALARIFKEEGIGLDVASGGELAIAKSVDFPMDKIYFNGNNKSAQELEMALDWSVGRIVVDNLYELSMLEDAAKRKRARAKILLRLSPGVDPHTHTHLVTGATDSKFGFPMNQASEAVDKSLASPSLDMMGFHFHIGSQIFDLTPHMQAIETVLDFAPDMNSKQGATFQELSIGGGLGITYTHDLLSPTVADFAEATAAAILKKCEAIDIHAPQLVVEPGRSIVGQAGVAVYTTGAIKHIEGVRKYVFVDGGMSDNIRYALYGATYEAVIANKMEGGTSEQVTIAGKLCESGDILIRDIMLPETQPGDILAVPCCGAYCLAMASNYNASLKPAIVLVSEGKARLIRRRESHEDLMQCDIE